MKIATELTDLNDEEMESYLLNLRTAVNFLKANESNFENALAALGEANVVRHYLKWARFSSAINNILAVRAMLRKEIRNLESDLGDFGENGDRNE